MQIVTGESNCITAAGNNFTEGSVGEGACTLVDQVVSHGGMR